MTTEIGERYLRDEGIVRTYRRHKIDTQRRASTGNCFPSLSCGLIAHQHLGLSSPTAEPAWPSSHERHAEKKYVVLRCRLGADRVVSNLF